MNIRRLRRGVAPYPPLLRAIPDPPAVLWLRGDVLPELLERPAVAIVGARACSSYGRSVSRTLGRELAAAGLVVVSGMARGIDSEAHRGALDAGGVTVAVLGCGIDRDYPAANRDLARRIVEQGLIVSEYEAGVEPAPWRFPARNRIIAGLCMATVVIEARERSGALITADFALEDGREVMVVPGEITSAVSAGSNALLRLGATPVTAAADVLEAYGIELVVEAPAAPGGLAGKLLERLADQPASIDELARSTRRSPAEVAAALIELELAGRVGEDDGVYRTTITR
jgi:DNA processing protein